MSETVLDLRSKINSATTLQSVVHTMKVLAASSIGQYERSVQALRDYNRTVELGLSVCFQSEEAGMTGQPAQGGKARINAIVFGSDQGLVGRFNEVITEYTFANLNMVIGKPQFWTVSERIHAHLLDVGVAPMGSFTVPNSVGAITPLVGQLLIAIEADHNRSDADELYLFYNRPTTSNAYEPFHQRLLPLDDMWRRELADLPWPTKNLPEIMGTKTTAMQAFIREYLFVSLFRACTESLAAENASRLAAMQRADKNIQELLEDLKGTYHRLRQDSIDAELFDVVAGFEALLGKKRDFIL